jgi:hypothetical protein
MTSIPPMNGTKTHPLTPHALSVLKRLLSGPEPQQSINPGVVNRLMREDLVTIAKRPSPFATHKNRPIDHLEITDAGRAALARPSTQLK